MNRFVTIIAAATLAVSATNPALAQNDDAAVAKVSYGDIDLSSAKGQRLLKLRVSRAAAAVCDQVNERFDTAVRVEQGNCRADTVRTSIGTIMAINAIQIAAR
jgi:UrcA family protein